MYKRMSVQQRMDNALKSSKLDLDLVVSYTATILNN